MKRLFVRDVNGEAAVLFVDEAGKAVFINETAFGCKLTLEVAMSENYSQIEGYENAEDAAANYYTGDHLINYKPDDWNEIIEF